MLDRTSSRRGRNRDASKPKGRQLDEAALADVRRLLGDAPRQRDLLIEYLHLIQDEFRCLQAKHLRTLAEEMRLSQVEVYEVASFYDHFAVVKEGEPIPAPLTIRVCDSVSCMLAGAEELIEQLNKNVNPEEIRVMRAPCMGGCDVAPAARVGDREVGEATAAKLMNYATTGQTKPMKPTHKKLDTYLEEGGYTAWDRVQSGELTGDEIINMLSDAGLRGLGGAGFPTGKKWSFARL